VDATVIDYGFLLEAESQAPGQFHALVSLADEFPELQTSGIHVYQPWAEENPELVQGFVRALVEAQRRIYEEPEALYAAAVDHLDLDPEFAKELADAYLAIELWDRNGALTEENLQYTLDFLGDIEAIPAGLRTEDVAELSYLNSVLDELGRQ
jgi:ABC-type nitrate/sulfonate/bicarbonate transport system substrate-binding protein